MHRRAKADEIDLQPTLNCRAVQYVSANNCSGAPMAPRRKPARSAPTPRSSLTKLLELANNVMQQSNGGDALSLPDLDAAGRFAEDVSEQALAGQSPKDMAYMREKVGNNLAAAVSLFSLSLEESSPFTTNGPRGAYASIRQALTHQLKITQTGTGQDELLGEALLRGNALECYARLLAEAAEQLKPAAAAMPLAKQERAVTEADANAQPDRVQRGTAAGGERVGEQQSGLDQLNRLLQELHVIVGAIAIANNAPVRETPNKNIPATSTTSSSGRSSAVAGPSADRLVLDAPSRVQSSWVLEHWARVLLLGTAPALASGDSAQQQTAQGLIAGLVNVQCKLMHWGKLDWDGFVARPCGGALAAVYLSHLCDAMEEAHELPGRMPSALSAAGPEDPVLLERMGHAAAEYDFAAIKEGRGVCLFNAARILHAWTSHLSEALWEGPEAAVTHGGWQAGGAAGGQGTSGGQRPATPAAAGGETGAGTTPEGVAPWRLPPLNRAATFHLCLRLARAVLARWEPPAASTESAGVRVAPNWVVLKCSACGLLYQALACARLALLPDVWGRARVRGRVRAQLRAWWETYVAAAQHPEALVVGMQFKPSVPAWLDQRLGTPLQPSADAAAALEAGLLPCVTALVTRMGAGCGGNAAWCPPELFPGVDRRWGEMMLFGPLGQVNDLVSAVGRRARLAVKELLWAVVAAGAGTAGAGTAERLGGRDVGWLAEVSCAALCFVNGRLSDTFRGLGTGGWTGPAGVTPAEELASAEVRRARASCAIAELLPALSLGVQAYAQLGQLAGRGGGEGREAAAGQAAAAEVVGGYMDRAVCWAGVCVLFVKRLLRLHIEGAAAEGHAEGHGDGADGCGGANGEGDSPWPQLLLVMVRLMRLLGAAVQLAHSSRGQEQPQPQQHEGAARGPAEEACPYQQSLREVLVHVLPMTAAAFPAEFREAVGSGVGAQPPEGVVGAGAGTGAAAEAAAKAGPSLGDAHSCISLALVREVLEGAGAEASAFDPLGVVTRVVGGWEPTPGELRGLAQRAGGL